MLKDSEDKLHLLTHTELYDGLKARLEKYLIAEDVEIIDSDLRVYGVIGNKSLKRFPEGHRGKLAGEEVGLVF